MAPGFLDVMRYDKVQIPTFDRNIPTYTLKMETADSSERRYLTYQTTQRHNNIYYRLT